MLDARLLEAPPNELEQVVGLPLTVMSLEPRLSCLEDASRVRVVRGLPPPANRRAVRRGVAALAAPTVFLAAGALDGRSVPGLVPLVCAARISGAISAISGSEFGAGYSATVCRFTAAGSLTPPRCVFSGSRR